MKIVLASRNKHKIREINTLISGVYDGIEVLSLDDIGHIGEIEEDGKTFEENSAIKATVPTQSGYIGIADDSGLSVDVLDGAPGVYSARYAGEPCDDKKNNAKLLSVMAPYKEGERGARFVSVVTIMFPRESELYDFDESVLEYGVPTVSKDGSARGFSCRGECLGHMIFSEQGSGGFGYDPLFMCDAYGKTFAQLDMEEKNKISHRGEAMRRFTHDLARVLASVGIIG